MVDFNLALQKFKENMKNKVDLCVHGINRKFCEKCKTNSVSLTKKQKKEKLSLNGFKLSADQQQAVETILAERGPFLLCGGAGSGKSFVVRWLKENVEDCVTCAMTGAAAQLIDDETRTAHSFLGILPVSEWLRKKRVADKEPNPAYHLKEPKISAKTGKIERDWANANVAKAKMIIIDEISMASSEFVRRVGERLIKACGNSEEERKYWPKIVFVGDLLQLPPTEGERFYTVTGIEKFKVLQLTQQHRQAAKEDKDFLTALNEIRVGVLSDTTKDLFKQRLVNELPLDCTHLHAKNELVDITNQRRLEELSKDPVEIEWEVDANEGEEQEKINTAIHYARNKEGAKLVEKLRLKVGARIIILNNDSSGKWVNGSTGEIVGIKDSFISIVLDRNNETVDVPKLEEDLLYGHHRIGVVRQFPLRLGYAITIHKAQGLTLDRVGVNLSDHFDCGMTYVALSRCRFFHGLFLSGRFPEQIQVDQQALDFLAKTK